jgi:hypothetical protein
LVSRPAIELPVIIVELSLLIAGINFYLDANDQICGLDNYVNMSLVLGCQLSCDFDSSTERIGKPQNVLNEDLEKFVVFTMSSYWAQ